MSARQGRLERGILEFFKLACANGRPEVAEHLLHAVECIDAAEPALGGTGRPALDQAYRVIARLDE